MAHADTRRWLPFLALALATTGAAAAVAAAKNGFDLTNALVPVSEIRAGGPPRDGIPALTNPEQISAAAADYLKGEDRVLGVTLGTQARAYPVKILNWHEVVNDRIGSQHFVVSYCPLCGTGMVFGANLEGSAETGSALVFGVSGLLYNSDLLLFDRNTGSLWSQILGKAISGPLKGSQLPQLPALHTTWAAWRARHPHTRVLSRETGFKRNYDRSPYAGYERSPRLYFQVANRAPRDFHPKALVLGVKVGGVYKAYPFEELAALGQPRLDDTVNGKALVIHWDPAASSAEVTDADGSAYPGTVGYWFAWYAFYPRTEVFKASALTAPEPR